MTRHTSVQERLCKAALTAVTCVAFSIAHADERHTQISIPGTYEILICKPSCPPAGEKNVVIKGRLVLLNSSSPNGCFELNKIEGVAYNGYAGITKVGATTWSVKADGLHFSLFRSPDAGYEVTARHTKTDFVGTGVSWGAGVVAPPAGQGPDQIVMRRIGDADMGACQR